MKYTDLIKGVWYNVKCIGSGGEWLIQFSHSDGLGIFDFNAIALSGTSNTYKAGRLADIDNIEIHGEATKEEVLKWYPQEQFIFEPQYEIY